MEQAKPTEAPPPAKGKKTWVIVAGVVIIVIVVLVGLYFAGYFGQQTANKSVSIWENPLNSCGTSTECGYTPATLTVTRGQTAQWTNDGGLPHTATACHPDFSPPSTYCPNGTSSALKFDTGTLSGNQKSSIITIDVAPGTYYYYCTVHPTIMHGTISVTS